MRSLLEQQYLPLRKHETEDNVAGHSLFGEPAMIIVAIPRLATAYIVARQ
jgi:hypothetical protein